MTGILKVSNIKNPTDSQSISIDRTSSDGDIIDLQKDGTTVGSIGVADSGDRIYLAGGGLEGVGIDNGANAFVPTSEAGAFKDNHLSLGTSSARFENLYLSGGAYLGGTGSANYLDDYEEGDFSYSIQFSTSGSLTVRAGYTRGYYTKVGRLVTINLRFETQGSSGTLSGDLELSGLPFSTTNTAPTNSNVGYSYPILLRGVSGSSYEYDLSFYFTPVVGTSSGIFYGQGDGSQYSLSAITNSAVTGNLEGTLAFTYITDS